MNPPRHSHDWDSYYQAADASRARRRPNRRRHTKLRQRVVMTGLTLLGGLVAAGWLARLIEP